MRQNDQRQMDRSDEGKMLLLQDDGGKFAEIFSALIQKLTLQMHCTMYLISVQTWNFFLKNIKKIKKKSIHYFLTSCERYRIYFAKEKVFSMLV